MLKLLPYFLQLVIELLDLVFDVLLFLFKDNSAHYFIFDALVEYLVDDGIVSNIVELDPLLQFPSLNGVPDLSSRRIIHSVLMDEMNFRERSDERRETRRSSWISRFLLPSVCSGHGLRWL